MPRFALVHDWFDCLAGSEKVVREMKHCFPQAELFSLVDHLSSSDRHGLGIGDELINTSFVQRLPFSRTHFRHYLALMPLAIEQFDLSEYDVVLSSSHAVAKGVVTNAEQLHISYIHTPIRYAWDMYHEYLQQRDLTRGVKSLIARGMLHYIRNWDVGTASRPDIYVANSNYVARRIRKTYGREAHVIYPPVNVQGCEVRHRKDDFFLAAGRLVPYKRFDLIVDAFARMPDRRLVVIGDGMEFKKLKSRATPNVQMLGYQEDAVLIEYMQRARAFVFGAVEDFGIMPVEAQACGTPVIGVGKGGVAETVIHGETGLHVASQTPECFASAIEDFCGFSSEFWDADRIRKNAERFCVDRFRRELSELVATAIQQRSVSKCESAMPVVPDYVSSSGCELQEV